MAIPEPPMGQGQPFSAEEWDSAARQLYARWCADWRELEVFIAERLDGRVEDLTPRRLVVAMLGMARPHVARPLLRAWVDRSPWNFEGFHHRHHHTERLPIRGHVWIEGAPTTSLDNAHFHVVDPSTQWTEHETLDFSWFM